MNGETVIMETVKINIIRGTISGISKEDFENLKDRWRKEWEWEELFIRE